MKKSIILILSMIGMISGTTALFAQNRVVYDDLYYSGHNSIKTIEKKESKKIEQIITNINDNDMFVIDNSSKDNESGISTEDYYPGMLADILSGKNNVETQKAQEPSLEKKEETPSWARNNVNVYIRYNPFGLYPFYAGTDYLDYLLIYGNYNNFYNYNIYGYLSWNYRPWFGYYPYYNHHHYYNYHYNHHHGHNSNYKKPNTVYSNSIRTNNNNKVYNNSVSNSVRQPNKYTRPTTNNSNNGNFNSVRPNTSVRPTTNNNNNNSVNSVRPNTSVRSTTSYPSSSRSSSSSSSSSSSKGNRRF